MRRFKKTLAAVLVGAMLVSTASCGKANPDDYEYGQSINQVTDDNTVIAGNGENGGGVIGGGENGGGDEAGEPYNSMDKWIEKLEVPAEPSVPYADTENKEFEAFLDELFKEKVEGDTLSYNYTVKNGDVYGVKAPSPATLGDADSIEAYDEIIKEAKEEYEKLMKFEGQPLTADEYFTFLVLKADYELDIFRYENIAFEDPFAPMRGFQANIGSNLAEYRFDDKQDVEDYILLENQLKDYVAKLCDYENERAAKGYVMQDANIDEVIEQCDEFAKETDQHFLILEFDSKMDQLDFLTDQEKAAYKEQNKKAVIDSVIPSMIEIRDCLKANKGKATVTGGLAQYDGGKEYYEQFVIPYYGGCKLSAEDLAEIFEHRYQADYNRMIEIVSQNTDAYSYYIEHSEDLFADADSMQVSDVIDTLMNDCMDEYPKLDKINYKADYLSPAMEKIMDSTLAYYMSPARDDKDGNIIRVNGSHPEGMWVTLAHEGCPGHMYQNNYFQSTNPHPLRADAYYLGYMEGWAVYSSYRTMAQYDIKDTDADETIAELAKIDKELGYMIYGRIDVGVNYEGWTEEDLKNYMDEMGFNSEYAGELMQTVVGDPGVYLSYSFSQFMMEGMRVWAEEELGDKFDAVEFHKAILDPGPCQFEELKFKLDEYVNAQ